MTADPGFGGGRGAGGYRPRSLRTFFASALATPTVPARRRVSVLGLTSSRCRRPACWRRSFPLPVTLTRFAVPLCVFILGMTVPFAGGAPGQGAATCRTGGAERWSVRASGRRAVGGGGRRGVRRGPRLDRLLVRSDHHRHVPAVLLGRGLDGTVVDHVLG